MVLALDYFTTEPEASWHRRQRRKRTFARTVLRNVTGGLVSRSHPSVAKAVRALRQHHSKSSLPEAVTAMAAAAWKCVPCSRMCGKAADFCGKCGKHWSQVAEGYTAAARNPLPWKPSRADEEQWPRSPRKRSPRARRPQQTGKGQTGQQQPQPKGAPGAKGGGKAEVAKPSVDALPPPPPAVLVAGPKGATSTTSSSSSTEKAQLEALTGCLFAVKDHLPQEVRETLEKLQLVETATTTKDLHRAVASQAQAKRQLLAIQAARATYMEAWHSYVDKVSKLLQTQMAEQQTQLEAFDEAELQWSNSLEKSSADLARLAKGAAGVSSDLADMDLDEQEAQEALEEADIRTAGELTQRREKQLATTRRLVEAVESVLQSAQEQMSQQGREGSRTPRRRKDSVMDLTKDDLAPAAGEPQWPEAASEMPQSGTAAEQPKTPPKVPPATKPPG